MIGNDTRRTFQRVRAAALLALLIGALGSPAAHPTTRALEQAVEATIEYLVLPSGPTGDLRVRGCSRCPEQTLRVDVETRFQIGERAVSRGEFASFAQANGRMPLAVFYREKTRTVTRIRIQAPSEPR